MAAPRVIVLRAAGINCEAETLHAWELAGARGDIVHVNRVLEQPRLLERYAALTIPGGFSYGDDIAAGRILARRIVRGLGETISQFRDRGGLVLGICNGFQVLVQAGLLRAGDERLATLAFNTCGHYVCRWVTVACAADHCVMLAKGRRYFLPMAHAEGRITLPEGGAVDAKRAALRYAAGVERVGEANPNGSWGDLAGLTDATGRILGLMPHPERYVRRTQHPFWTAGDLPEEGDGLAIFRAAVNAMG
ncbi:MAG TPA: phosphoribosylformylglycinamidine synthase subunit PurQ [Phycisphaerae bacterium]|nr:phosphoribosylformylglycinamidine synthase subunit PurQ [Phycisphaerae bacterium]